MIVVRGVLKKPVFHLPGYRKITALSQNSYRILWQTFFKYFFLPGAANGILPCGLVYMAITGAWLQEQLKPNLPVLFLSVFPEDQYAIPGVEKLELQDI